MKKRLKQKAKKVGKRKSFKEKLWIKVLERINTTGGVLVVLGSSVGFGVTIATYVCSVTYGIKINEINQQHNIELTRQYHDFQEQLWEKNGEIEELKQKNRILEYNINKGKYENDK